MVARVAPLVVVVGETASGKSDLAMFLAKKFNGEIIAADSRTIYKGMDIGTAKPSMADRLAVPHHLLDVVEPGERYTAAQFKEDASKIVDEIWKRGHLPIMVGGTGLYVDSVLFDYQFGQEVAPKVRAEIEALGMDELQKRAISLGISNEEVNFKNRRHLQRAVERGSAGGMRDTTLRPNTLIIGVSRDRQDLEIRIEKRIDKMLRSGFIEEVQKLLNQYGFGSEAMTGIGYRAYVKYLRGEFSFDQARQEFIKGDKGLAKRQRTWFKRNKSIHWVSKRSKAVELVTTLLSKN